MTDFFRTYPPAVPVPGPAIWLPFFGKELLVHDDGDASHLLRAPTDSPPVPPSGDVLYLGTLGAVPCLACDAAGDYDAAGEYDVAGDRSLRGLRALLARLSAPEAAIAGYAAQLLYWQHTSRFCPVCGAAAEAKPSDWGKQCPRCGHAAYPHISPAVLALVYDGPRLLLVHKPEWTTMHSIVAGFVEPNESLEDCVRREVREETGLDVDTVQYQGSQAWPFPHQLMVGFTARYAGGEIAAEEAELDGAAWFTSDALPDLPPATSLSRQLINAWLDTQ